MLLPISNKSKCILCLKEISTEEFLTYDHRCESCDEKENFRGKDRCEKCRHIPHKGRVCGEQMTRQLTPEDKILLCECGEEK